MTEVERPVRSPSLPPVHLLLVLSMGLVIVGGILMAAHLPGRPPLAAPLVFLGAAVVLLLVGVGALSRIQGFDWRTFFRVGRWVLLAYGVIAGMLEYVFVFDHTRGSVLVVLTSMLLVFAVDVPIVLAFSVARYQEPAAHDGP